MIVAALEDHELTRWIRTESEVFHGFEANHAYHYDTVEGVSNVSTLKQTESSHSQ